MAKYRPVYKQRKPPDGWPVAGRFELFLFVGGTLLFWTILLTAKNHYVWFIDNANLMLHEAGHLIFLPLGTTMHMWGGTLLQCAMPMAFAISFRRRRQPAGAAVSGLWLGENFLNISHYAADAQAMALPLVVGNVHDWNFLLGQLGLIGQCRFIAGFLWLAGWLIMLAAAGWYVWRWNKMWQSKFIGI